MIIPVSPIAFLAVPPGKSRFAKPAAQNVAAATTALALAVLQLAPLSGRGYVLNRDMVFVPKLPLNDTLLGVTGVPRAVPSDLVVGLLSRAVPGEVVQDLVLLFVIAVGGWGAGRLMSRSVIGAIAAAALYSWNPYLTERLLLGQWAILLGYAALPWIAAAALEYRNGDSRALARLVVWLGVAAIGGASAEVLAALVAIPILGWPSATARERAKQVAIVMISLGLLALPWLIPAVTNPGGVPPDRVGATAFASRPDTPFGSLGSLLSLGGVWNSDAVPPGRSHWYVAVAALVVTAIAMWGLVLVRRQRGAAVVGGISVAAGLGLALALWAHLPGLNHALRWLSAHSQAVDLFRDGQRQLAPFVLAVALGWGWAVAELAAQAKRAAVIAAVPVLILPSAAWGVSGALVAVNWPKDWKTVSAATDELPPGPVLVLPWASVRAYPWNGDRAVIDPANRWLDRRVVVDGQLLVLRSGAALTTAQEDPLARAIGSAAQGDGSLTATLRSRGYAGVLVERDVATGNQQVNRLRGTRLVVTTPTLALYAVSGATTSMAVATGSVPATVAGDVVALLVVIIAGTICVVSAVRRTGSV